MKKSPRNTALKYAVLSLAVLLLLCACVQAGAEEEESCVPDKIRFASEKVSLLAGEETVLTVTLKGGDPEAYDREYGGLAFSVIDGMEDCVTLGESKKGEGVYTLKVTALKPGLCVIMARVPSDDYYVRHSCAVFVHSPDALYVPEGVSEVNSETFSGTAFEEAVLPEGVTAIASGAFRDCTALRMVTIPASVTSITGDAFEGCGKLTVLCVTGTAGHSFAMENKYVFYAAQPNEPMP